MCIFTVHFSYSLFLLTFLCGFHRYRTFNCHTNSDQVKSDFILLCCQSLFFREKMPNDLPAFQKLTRLELSMQLGVHSGGALMKFLLHLPNLESLNISKATMLHL